MLNAVPKARPKAKRAACRAADSKAVIRARAREAMRANSNTIECQVWRSRHTLGSGHSAPDCALLGDGHVLFDGHRIEGETAGEAFVEAGRKGAFRAKVGDMVMLMPGFGMVIPYLVEIVVHTGRLPELLPLYRLRYDAETHLSANNPPAAPALKVNS